jgi:hypothetical protein
MKVKMVKVNLHALGYMGVSGKINAPATLPQEKKILVLVQ